MPITSIGPICKQNGCPRPVYSDGLCALCYRLALAFGHDIDIEDKEELLIEDFLAFLDQAAPDDFKGNDKS